MNWFEVKVSYPAIDEGTGKEITKRESYLTSSVSFTDAETMVTKELEQVTKGDFRVEAIKRSNISEVLSDKEGTGYFYKVKLKYITITDSGKEKRAATYMLVEADSTQQATGSVEAETGDWLVDVEVVSIVETQFAGILTPENYSNGQHDEF
jgi:hypothetical protein